MSTTNSDKLILSADSDALSIDRWFQLANNILVSKEPDVRTGGEPIETYEDEVSQVSPTSVLQTIVYAHGVESLLNSSHDAFCSSLRDLASRIHIEPMQSSRQYTATTAPLLLPWSQLQAHTSAECRVLKDTPLLIAVLQAKVTVCGDVFDRCACRGDELSDVMISLSEV